jgi:O-methyltransferase involved in polyketide biosynthesis
MDPAKASATATGVAVARGAHRSCDQPPWVLDDPFALQLAGPRWAEIQSASEAAFPETALRQSRASVVARSRYAEDRLVSGGYRQYVILGAGLDSFAWRRAGLIGWLRLFEVDHPASQAWNWTGSPNSISPSGTGTSSPRSTSKPRRCVTALPGPGSTGPSRPSSPGSA